MPGVRLHHPVLSSCTLVVETMTDFANREPRMCSECGKPHDRKAVHLRLDAQGDVIVSLSVLESLKKVHLAGMELGNEVAKPPTLHIGAVARPTIEVVDLNLNGEVARDGYRPAVSKQEADDRMAVLLGEAK